MNSQMRPIRRIIVHTSDSPFGDAEQIDVWHRSAPFFFSKIGYHFVICNGYRQKSSSYDHDLDGQIQPGRPIKEKGAHTKGHNWDSIGICLIGDERFTARQLFESLPLLLSSLLVEYQLTTDNIFGHRDFSDKTCPNIPTRQIRRSVFMGAELFGFKNILNRL